MTQPAACDHELMAAVQERSAEAFETLAARYRDPLRRHLASMVRDPGAAEDLLQEALLRVWTRADRWDGGAVRAWVFRIATNLALNHLRTVRRRRETALEPPPERRPEGQEASVPAWMVDAASARPDQQTVQHERSRRLRRLVGALPAEKREVVELAAGEDLALREIAERLGIPEGTAKSRLHYARKWLSDQWIAYETEGEEWL